jgi:hypothetical protein
MSKCFEAHKKGLSGARINILGVSYFLWNSRKYVPSRDEAMESYVISTCHMYQNNNFEKKKRERERERESRTTGMCFLREAADHRLLDYKSNAVILWGMKASYK